jgi:hypothetical protein
MSIQQDLATIGGNETRDHVKAGRLARAIWSKKPDGFPAPDLEGDTTHHRPAPEALANLVDHKAGLFSHEMWPSILKALGTGVVHVGLERTLRIQRVDKIRLTLKLR